MSQTDIPKLQVDAKEDIMFIMGELKNATQHELVDATTKVRFDSKKKAVRAVAEDLLEKWVDDVFEMAGHSILVNGIEYSKAFQTVEELEPLDEQLDRKVKNADEQRRQMTVRVTTRRKTYPDLIMQVIQDFVKRESTLADRVQFSSGNNGEGDQRDSMNIPRIEETAQTYAEALDILKQLNETVPANIAKLGRAATVLAEENCVGVCPQ